MDDRISQPGADIPAGYELGPSGILVPVGDSPLEHEFWREEERKAILTARRVADKHDLLLMVGCRDNRCAEHPVIVEELLTDETTVGAIVWRCGHKRRVIVRGARRPGGRKGFRR